MGESKRANSRPEGAYREIIAPTWEKIARHEKGMLKNPWERGAGSGKLENGNKVKSLIGQGFKLGFVPIFHFPVPRSSV